MINTWIILKYPTVAATDGCKQKTSPATEKEVTDFQINLLETKSNTMALTLEDLMNFMKRDKEERAVERERDKEELKQIISKGVKDEVEAMIGPIKDKQEQLEQAQSDMQKGFSEVMAEVKDIRKQLADKRSESPTWASRLAGQLPSHSHAAQTTPGHHECEDDRVKEVISLGRRTVGLSRIDQEDLVRMRQEQFGGAKSEDEERCLQ